MGLYGLSLVCWNISKELQDYPCMQANNNIIIVIFFADEKEYPDILTVRNIVKKLAQWSDRWIRVAECLEVPSAMISTIRVITTHQHSGDTALYKVVEWWFANNPNPEWAAVNKVIEEFERGSPYSVSQ